LIMLGLGSAGMFRELFLVDDPNLTRMSVAGVLILGPAVAESWWRARNPLPTPAETRSPEPQSGSASGSP